MNNPVIAAYQKNWNKNTSEQERAASQQRVYETIARLFKEVLHDDFKGSILDIGCGDGALVKLLNSKDGVACKGIDINQGVDFEKDKLPFKDHEFDIIIMYSVIEHVHNPGNILMEIKRVCKPQGKLVVMTANFDLTNPLTYDRSFYHDPTHIHPYNYISIESLMNLYDLKKRFIGLWTVGQSTLLWKLSSKMQFYIGALLPFRGQTKFVPAFLKGKSKTMLCVFQNG